MVLNILKTVALSKWGTKHLVDKSLSLVQSLGSVCPCSPCNASIGNTLVVARPSFSSLHPPWCHLARSSVPCVSYKPGVEARQGFWCCSVHSVTSDANSDSVGLEWGQRRYTFNKLPGNTYDRRLIRFRDFFFFSLFPFSIIFDQIQAQCFEEQVMVHSSIRRPPTSGWTTFDGDVIHQGVQGLSAWHPLYKILIRFSPNDLSSY